MFRSKCASFFDPMKLLLTLQFLYENQLLFYMMCRFFNFVEPGQCISIHPVSSKLLSRFIYTLVYPLFPP